MKGTGIFFSPTGTTGRYVRAVVDGMGGGTCRDVLAQPLEQGDARYGPDELVVVGAPVFGGRAPGVALEWLDGLKGDGALCVPVVSYGARAFEDALLELSDFMEDHGFRVVAGGAVVSQHSMASSIAKGRPDEADLDQAAGFGGQVAEKLASGGGPAPVIPGGRPYRAFGGVPFHPHADKSCVSCGRCASQCPAGAIPKENPQGTDDTKCISCMHCAAVCPQGARSLGAVKTGMVKLKIQKECRDDRENQYFL